MLLLLTRPPCTAIRASAALSHRHARAATAYRYPRREPALTTIRAFTAATPTCACCYPRSHHAYRLLLVRAPTALLIACRLSRSHCAAYRLPLVVLPLHCLSLAACRAPTAPLLLVHYRLLLVRYCLPLVRADATPRVHIPYTAHGARAPSAAACS
ncbi:hypothetical protein C8R45DRAFT_1103201 [Mycena sanguinolenta]|nr:hypothetical protein C8R45DRAFT_1103201 [Mycena sanguinolenta]